MRFRILFNKVAASALHRILNHPEGSKNWPQDIVENWADDVLHNTPIGDHSNRMLIVERSKIKTQKDGTLQLDTILDPFAAKTLLDYARYEAGASGFLMNDESQLATFFENALRNSSRVPMPDSGLPYVEVHAMGMIRYDWE